MEKELFDEEIAVHCGGTMLAIEEVKANPNNPNIHPQDQLEAMAQILRQVGWREALVISKRSGLLVKGHGRLATARHMGLKKVPVEFQDYMDETQELADMIGDNRIAQKSYMDALGLGALLKKMDAKRRGALGYAEEEVGLLMAAEFTPAAPTERKFQVLETLKMTKSEKEAVGHAVQTWCLRTGKEVSWGEAMAAICRDWERGLGGAPAAEPKEVPTPGPEQVTSSVEPGTPSTGNQFPVEREVVFAVSRVAGTTLQDKEVFVIYPAKGEEKFYTDREEVAQVARDARNAKPPYKVRGTAAEADGVLWVGELTKEA